MNAIEIKNLTKRYRDVTAVDGLSLSIREGELFSLLGINGAGKTTTIKMLSLLTAPDEGEAYIFGHSIRENKAGVKSVIALSPQGTAVAGGLTVYENLKMGYFIKKDKAEFEKRLEEVYESFPILKERSSQIAGTLSGGEQQMLAMSRALMSSPKLLLLDEPSMGLSPLYVNIIFDMIKKVNALGTTVLLVEQNAKKALSIADRAYVLEIGKIVKTGTGKELLDDEDIRKAYLGG